MKKLLIWSGSLILVLLLLALLYFVFKDSNSISAVLYYLDSDQTCLVADNTSIHYEDASNIPENIISRLKGGKLFKKSPIPKDCRVNSVNIDSSHRISVDMSDEFLSGNEQLDVLRTYAVVKSICSTSQFIGITEVRVTAGGNPIKSKAGTALGYLSNSAINVMNSEEVMTYECELYFLSKASNSLKSERRKIDASNGTVETNAVKALINGPQSKHLQGIFPRGTKLISAQTMDTVCYVNFSALPQGADIKIIHSALKRTLSAFHDIKDVKILLSGKDPLIN